MNAKLIGIGVAALLSSHLTASAKKRDKTPNVIFILADDLGYGDVSCFNENAKIITPNIDSLASSGVRFSNAHTSSSVCSPTRYGILTGRYSWRSTMKEGVLSGYSKSLIKQEQTTVAGLLKSKGYTTAFIGKWHLGWDWDVIKADPDRQLDDLGARPEVNFASTIKNGPKSHGFDYSYGFCGSLDMPPYVWVENDQPTMVPKKLTGDKTLQQRWRRGVTADDFVHEQVLAQSTQKAVKYINEIANRDKPFFLYFPLSAPHTPILPTGEFREKSGIESPYADFVLMVDWVIGEISKTLKNQGIEENTLFFFTSDNGCSPSANFGQLAKKGHHPSYVFRGQKTEIFEGGHRVPYIVSWPQKIKPGATDQLTCTTDLFATLADVLGIKYEDDVAPDSFSFLPALNMKSKALVRESIVDHAADGSFALTKGDWKVIFMAAPATKSSKNGNEKPPQFQLYNLKDDIGEKNNLQNKHPEIIAHYRQLLTKYVKEGRSTEGKPQKNDGPEFWPQLNWMKSAEDH